MELPEARIILFAAATSWATARLEAAVAEVEAFRTLTGPPKDLIEIRREMKMRCEIMDAAVEQYARILAEKK